MSALEEYYGEELPELLSDPQVHFPVDLSVRWTITGLGEDGGGEKSWAVEFKNGKGRVTQDFGSLSYLNAEGEEVTGAQVTVTLEEDTWEELANGEVELPALYVQGTVQVEGPMDILLQFITICTKYELNFGPSPEDEDPEDAGEGGAASASA